MRFIVIQDDFIIGDYCGDPAGVRLSEGQEMKEVSFDFTGIPGESIKHFDGERRKTVEELFNEGLLALSDDEEIKDNRIVKKPEPEKPFDLAEYKKQAVSDLSYSCYSRAEYILPREKQLNILFGANAHYPAYLQGETGKKNVKDFINIFQQIYHVNSVLIYAAKDKAEVDTIMSGITLPSETDILNNLGVV